MLRIEQRQEGGTIVVQVEGRVIGPWVEELRRVLMSALGTRATVALELASVGYVDAAGERLLREAVARGARLRGPSSFVATLLQGGEAGEPR